MEDEEYPEEEAERRASENLRRMLATPPQPKRKPAATPARSAPSKPGKGGQMGKKSTRQTEGSLSSLVSALQGFSAELALAVVRAGQRAEDRERQNLVASHKPESG